MSKWIVDIHGDIEGDYELIKKYEEPCKMTAEEYRQRMIQAFHNADHDEFIAICVLPTEKEFEHLEWLLKNHYEKETITEFADRCRECGARYGRLLNQKSDMLDNIKNEITMLHIFNRQNVIEIIDKYKAKEEQE